MQSWLLALVVMMSVTFWLVTLKVSATDSIRWQQSFLCHPKTQRTYALSSRQSTPFLGGSIRTPPPKKRSGQLTCYTLYNKCSVQKYNINVILHTKTKCNDQQRISSVYEN